MNKFLKAIGEAFFPASFTCDICGIETFGENICDRCKKSLSFNDGDTCPVCGRKTVRPEICLECKAKAPVFRKAVSPLVYEGGTVILIARFKNGNGYLKDYFAELIADKLTALPHIDCSVYVPMTKNAVRKRGYNQAELLAKAICEKTGIPVIQNAVIKTKETSEQKLLSLKERAENLKTCFKVEKRNEIKGKDVLIVDDVLTTGATSDAIGRKLLKAGAAHVYLATVASVEYKIKTTGQNN